MCEEHVCNVMSRRESGGQYQRGVGWGTTGRGRGRDGRKGEDQGRWVYLDASTMDLYASVVGSTHLSPKKYDR